MRASILLGLSFCFAFTSSAAIWQDTASAGDVGTHIEGI